MAIGQHQPRVTGQHGGIDAAAECRRHGSIGQDRLLGAFEQGDRPNLARRQNGSAIIVPEPVALPANQAGLRQRAVRVFVEIEPVGKGNRELQDQRAAFEHPADRLRQAGQVPAAARGFNPELETGRAIDIDKFGLKD